jgi:cytochrome c oxidase subunit 1
MTSLAKLWKDSYLGGENTVRSWLLTGDHKRIAVLYFISITLFFAIGGLAAAIFRFELTQPQGMFLQSDSYNRMFSLHGIVMVFLFLVVAIPASLGNFFVPIMIGARDLAFPKINLASWYIYVIGGVMVVAAIVLGGIDTGWTFYTPYSTSYAKTNVLLVGVAVFIIGFSSIFTAVNFIATIHTMRAPGLTWFRLPLFIWALYATSLVILLGTPVIAITVALLAVERLLGVGIFDPALGGDPVLFQHLFWFYSHPAVYIMILPGMGVVSELISAFSRRRVFGYKFIAMASLGIAAFGFLVWGHHMFVSGQSPYAGIIFSLISFLIAVPSGIKVFNWTATLYRGSVSFAAPMLYALGFIGLFTLGGLTGLFLATMATDVHLHDTYFVVAHFHYVMVGGTLMAYLGGVHYWWPKMTGKMYSEIWAQISAVIIFVGFNLTFFPQFIMGYMGMPRRYHLYPEEYQLYHVLSTAGSSILAVGLILPIFYLFWSLVRGENATANPWGVAGLEWETASPPPTENFKVQPVVDTEVYQYPPRNVRVSEAT